MAVDRSHDGCFEHGSRLYAVPSDSDFTVEQTARSYSEASSAPHAGWPRVHWSAFVGGVAGGLFLDVSAWHSTGLTDWAALAMMFGFGGIVGFATAIGIRQSFVWHPEAAGVVRLPAVEVPGEVAGAAPEDATADELVLWSVLTRRFRAAQVALASSSLSQDPREASPRSPTGTISPASTGALAELGYVTARHDYEPVAELLGLPLPD